jgi:hypothetical protein
LGDAAPAGGTALQDEALSGIQITSMMQVLGEVQRGIHSRQTAYHALRAAFPKVPEERINGMLDGIDVKPPQPEAPRSKYPTAQDDAPSFAEVDSLADKTEAACAGPMAGLIEPVRRLVRSAASLEEIRDGVLELYPEMDSVSLAETLGDAMVAAFMRGKASVR